MPLICINKKKINKHMSIRFSEYEPIETLNKFNNNVGWVWIDTFKTLPINKKNSLILKKFKKLLSLPRKMGKNSGYY